MKRSHHGSLQWLDDVCLSSAGQRDALVAAVHQLPPQSHDMQVKGSLLRLLACPAACLEAASKAATFAEHTVHSEGQGSAAHHRPGHICQRGTAEGAKPG